MLGEVLERHGLGCVLVLGIFICWCLGLGCIFGVDERIGKTTNLILDVVKFVASSVLRKKITRFHFLYKLYYTFNMISLGESLGSFVQTFTLK